MAGPRRQEPGTTEHKEPRSRSRQPRQPALIVAYPVSVALPIPKNGATVGRDWLAAHGVSDGEVSARHLQLHTRGARIQVEDVGSSNGTWLNRQRLAPQALFELGEGAVLRLGSTLLVYRSELEGPLRGAAPLGGLIGPFGLRSVARSLAGFRRQRPTTVLIQGETGTGKELAARVVAQTLGRERCYGVVNLAGVASGVFESQLFGHVAGAFSGAAKEARGVVREHDGGAVFLDEIGELPLDLQPKILRLLDNREVHPVGASTRLAVDVALIAATNRNLDQMVAAGSFRQDLLARLNQARLLLPPLRHRSQDIFAIARSLAPPGMSLDPAVDEIEVEAVERLLLERWPDNVRGLRAALSRIAAEDPEPGLRLWAVEEVLGPGSPIQPGQLTVEAVRAALAASGNVRTKAAQRLGVDRGKLLRFMKEHRIDEPKG